MLHLYIANKNYSSWSMRPWVLLTALGIPFTEHGVPFDDMAADGAFKTTLRPLTPTGTVPVLVDDAQQDAEGKPLAVWDSLAIVEYVAEYAVQNGLPRAWPQSHSARAQARSICAEMHGGFRALRSAFPMNIEASMAEIGQIQLRDNAALRADLSQVCSMWTGLLATHSGPFLFGAFSAADAYFAPVVMRMNTFQPPVPPEVAAYCQRITQQPAVAQWIAGALAEQTFVDFDEPYRLTR